MVMSDVDASVDDRDARGIEVIPFGGGAADRLAVREHDVRGAVVVGAAPPMPGSPGPVDRLLADDERRARTASLEQRPVEVAVKMKSLDDADPPRARPRGVPPQAPPGEGREQAAETHLANLHSGLFDVGEQAAFLVDAEHVRHEPAPIEPPEDLEQLRLRSSALE